ncbi:MAG TPA: hypothetical protein VJ501_05580 [Burkholderiaceae bacterium]|nr:hypothetical protein [Burkholderiaceae bacterium]
MRTCTKCRLSLPLTAFGKQRDGRDGLRSACKSCRRVENENWRQANSDYRADYYAQNASKEREQRRARYYGTTVAQESKEWVRVAKPLSDAQRAQRRITSTKWQIENAGRSNEIAMRRHAAKLKAVPSWADKNAICAVYDGAQRLSRTLGLMFHVDHVVPLQGKSVCGLHCEANLQVLLMNENMSKSNRAWPDKP